MTYYVGNHTEPRKQPPKLNEGGAAIQEKQPKEQTGSKGGLRGGDRYQGDLVDEDSGRPELPEGLQRERKGPLGPEEGRKSELPSHVPKTS